MKKTICLNHSEIIQKAIEIFSCEHKDASVERFRIPAIEKGLLGK